MCGIIMLVGKWPFVAAPAKIFGCHWLIVKILSQFVGGIRCCDYRVRSEFRLLC